MPKQKAKDFNVGVEAMRIMEEQNVTFKQAWDVALSEKRFLVAREEKTSD